MQNPARDVPRVVRELCEPVDANEMTAAVDKYFAEDAVFVCESLLFTRAREVSFELREDGAGIIGLEQVREGRAAGKVRKARTAGVPPAELRTRANTPARAQQRYLK